MDRAVLWCASGVIAFSAYAALILLLVFARLSSNAVPLKFSSKKEIEFQVVVDFASPALSVSKKNQSEQKKSPSKKNEATTGSKTPVAGTGIKKLFDSIPDKIPTKVPEAPSDNRDVVASRKKGERLQQQEDKLQENLQKILSQVNVKQRINFSVPDGEYDEYYAKVDAILSENWKLPKYQDSGYQNYSAEVLITIDDRGQFKYRIKKPSGDEKFDRILELFLEDMTLIEFPKYIHNTKRETSIVVTIGSER